MSPVLSAEEAAMALQVPLDFILRHLPVFGSVDDRSVLREDILSFLNRSAL